LVVTSLSLSDISIPHKTGFVNTFLQFFSKKFFFIFFEKGIDKYRKVWYTMLADEGEIPEVSNRRCGIAGMRRR